MKDADSWMFVLYNVMATTKETTVVSPDANVVLNLTYRLRYAHMPMFGESGHAVLRVIFLQQNGYLFSYEQLGYDS